MVVTSPEGVLLRQKDTTRLTSENVLPSFLSLQQHSALSYLRGVEFGTVEFASPRSLEEIEIGLCRRLSSESGVKCNFIL